MRIPLKIAAMVALALLCHARAEAVATSCTATATGIAFGSYVPTSSSSVTGVGSVSVTCTALVVGSVAYTIALSQGSGSFTNRTLSAAPYALLYNIYTDSARTMVWGDGSAGTSLVSDAYGILLVPVTRMYTAYGLIPGSQINAGAGTYVDSVVVTVTY